MKVDHHFGFCNSKTHNPCETCWLDTDVSLTQPPFCLVLSENPLVTEEALNLPEVVHRQVQLSADAPDNQLLRSEFYYEQVWRH